MKIRICCNVFTVEDCFSQTEIKYNIKALKVLVKKNTNQCLCMEFDEKTDIKIQLRKKLQEVLGTNFFHLEQAYTLGDSKFYSDGFIDVVYVAITNKEHLKKLSDQYEFVNVRLVTKKSITLRNETFTYTTKEELINNNVEYYHIVNCDDLSLEKELVKLIISLKFISNRIKNTGIIFYMLNKQFILEDIRLTYELITEEKVDKANFRKKYKKYCRKTNEKINTKSFRPADIYECNLKIIEKLYR